MAEGEADGGELDALLTAAFLLACEEVVDRDDTDQRDEPGLFAYDFEQNPPLEVQHLLDYLRASDCVMERNGERHSGEDAYAHVKKKYDYFRDEIKTPEEFIEYAATKSTMSGKYYWVICPDDPPVRTRDWFLDELHRYRG